MAPHDTESGMRLHGNGRIASRLGMVVLPSNGHPNRRDRLWSAAWTRSNARYHTLIYHGDADTLVPLEQSVKYQQQAQQVNAEVQLVVHPGGQHGWPTMFWDLRKFADWFDQYLVTAQNSP